jgi:hypothetical protein
MRTYFRRLSFANPIGRHAFSLYYYVYFDPYCSKNLKACNLAFGVEDYVAVSGDHNLFHGWGLEDDEFAAGLLIMELKKRRPKLAAICYHLNHDCNPKYHIENQAMHYETIINKRYFSTMALPGLIQ